MAKGTIFLLILVVAVLGQALTPTSYFTTGDIQRLKALFAGAQPYGSDLDTVYYSILGYSLLDEPFPDPAAACEAVKNGVDNSNVDSIFYASVSANLLKTRSKTTCTLNGADEAKTTLTAAATSEESSAETIYQAVHALSALGGKIDSIKAGEALDAALKKDDAPLSHGFAFLAAAHLTGDLTRFHDLIEDVIAQADEVDEQFFQFDGGLYTTAIVIDGAYKLSAAAKLKPTLTEDKVAKFANYFLSRKHAQQLKNAASILSVVKTLTDNQYHIPIAVTLASSVSVTAQKPTVQIRVSNLLGGSLGGLTVTADTARHLGDDAVVMSKTPLTASTTDGSLYELNFMSVKPAHGFYKITVNVVPTKADKRLIGISGAEVEVKVTTQISLENVEIGVADKDQNVVAKATKLAHPNKAANILEADHQQKVTMKFELRERVGNTAIAAHQTFIRLTNLNTHQEIIFVAEPDNNNLYRFDLDVGSNAGEFGHQSGKYSMDLVVGDAVIENPLSWTVADVDLSFQEGPATKGKDESRYKPKPEIKHTFAVPDPRPSTMVSTVFTVLVLTPLLILLVLWVRVGVNLANLPVSLNAAGFHLGLLAIFAVYYLYWVQLNMFETLRYVGLIAIPTFLCGNGLLSSIAAARK